MMRRSVFPAGPAGWFHGGWTLLALLLTASAIAEGTGNLTAAQRLALDGIARDRFAIRWTDLDTNQLGAMARKALAYEASIRERHLPHGLVVSLRSVAPDRPEVRSLEALELSTGWTGFYLASTAYRFSVTRDPVALADVRRVLDGVEQAIVASGRPGFVPAYAGPASDPAYREVYATYGGPDPERPGMGRLAFRGEDQSSGLVWLAGADARNLAGLNFGLAMAYWRIREPGIRERISRVVERLVGRLEADHWRIRDGRTPETFVGPLLSAALLRTAATVDYRKYNAAYEARTRFLQEMDPPVAPPYSDLRSTAFDVGSLLALSGLETNVTRKLICQSHLKDLWRSSGPELNPWYAAAYVNGFDEPPRDMVARAILQGVLAQFPEPPRRSPPVDLLASGEVPAIEANGRRWLAQPAQLPDRPAACFQWAWPASLPEGGDGVAVVHPGVDYLLPFWMGRDAGLIPSEDAVPVSTSLHDRFRRSGRVKPEPNPAERKP